MTLLFSFCKVRHEREGSLRAVEHLPSSPVLQVEEQSNLHVCLCQMRASPGCVFCLWKTAGPSVCSVASRAVFAALGGSGGSEPCPCEEGRWLCPPCRGRAAGAPSSGGCFSFARAVKVCRTQMISQSWVSPAAWCWDVSSAWKPWRAWNLPSQVGRTGPQQPHWERRVWGRGPGQECLSCSSGLDGTVQECPAQRGESQRILQGSLVMA